MTENPTAIGAAGWLSIAHRDASGKFQKQPPRLTITKRVSGSREIERYIRWGSGAEAVALDAIAQRMAADKVRERQAETRRHVAENDLRRLHYREQVGSPGQPLTH